QKTGQRYVATGSSDFQGTVNIPGWSFAAGDFQINPGPAGRLRAVVFLDFHETGALKGVWAIPSGLVSWWKADGDASDALGANPGSLVSPVAFVAGRDGLAFDFPASLDIHPGYIEVQDSASLKPAAVTVAAWVRRTGSPGASSYVASKGAL